VTRTRFTDRVVIATGTASGLGLATARQFAEEGARLVLVDRAEQALAQVIADLSHAGAQAVPVAGDVSRASTAQQAVQTALSEFGRVDRTSSTRANNGGMRS
jgi:NAD(P)-dependent dehydrogenase (short-subunit alcohol dehydrogenase family)